MNVKIKKLYPDAIMPTYGTTGAACFDLYANQSMIVGRTAVGTGLAFEVPEGHVMLVYSRSSHALKGIRLANSVGVIDSDYRGEVKVMLEGATDVGMVFFDKGDRIAQAMIVPVERVTFTEVEELSETARGAGGFGSTGK